MQLKTALRVGWVMPPDRASDLGYSIAPGRGRNGAAHRAHLLVTKVANVTRQLRPLDCLDMIKVHRRVVLEPCRRPYNHLAR